MDKAATSLRPKVDALWKELLKRAGPSASIPVVDARACFDSVGIGPDEREAVFAMLLQTKAAAPLTLDDLTNLARRKRIVGDFVQWVTTSGVQFLRVEDPDDLRVAILAEIEILRRQDAELELKGVPVGDEKRWKQFWTSCSDEIKAEAEAFWKARCMSTDVPQELTPHIGRKYLEQCFVTAAEAAFPNRQVLEQRKAVALRLEALSAVLPLWSRHSIFADYRREQIPKAVQQEVWRRDQGRCVECGSKEKLEFDHVIPVSKGGATTVRNLQLLCERCNRSKNNSI